MFHQTINSKAGHYSGVIYTSQSWNCHFHNSFEMIHVIRGSLEVTVNDENITMSQEKFLLISPCMAHSIHSSSDSEFFISIFTSDFVPELHKDAGISSFYLFGVDAETLAYLKSKMIYASPTRSQIKACLYAVCASMEKGILQKPKTSENFRFVFAVNDYISKNLTQNFKRRDIAEFLGYEEHYFSELFRKNFGIGLKKHLNIHRLTHAQKLLMSTDKSVADIAYESGFPSVRSFNNAFKELSGKSPSEYRKTKSH